MFRCDLPSFSCRKQIISFLASYLGVPEMFDSNSANSVHDLALALQEDATPVMQMLLKSLTEELVAQEYLPMVHKTSCSLYIYIYFCFFVFFVIVLVFILC